MWVHRPVRDVLALHLGTVHRVLEDQVIRDQAGLDEFLRP
jgi:hypothetical protein